MLVSWLLTIAASVIASITDFKNKTIPIFLFPVTAILAGIWQLYTKNFNVILSVCGLAVMAIIYFIASFLGSGGGDIIMMSCIGFILGLQYSLFIALVSILVFIPFCIIKKFKDKENEIIVLPYAPFVFFSTTVTFVFYLAL